ncbi:PH domain-containing protein [Kocuria sp. LUK]|uniref:PH domain-containing protein n=1 Tax=Kocuria sp. LUK TaxID=2897828 RepID=UPI001E2EB1EC|nr:PH domain-containing protein [Kocuria sp. LUK]MCD1145924.1 PH domain-containing protein [Kocuria sp. LUK]
MSGAPAPAAGPAAGHPGEEAVWRRVHPLTPVVRGWLAVLVLGGAFVNIVLDDLVGGYLGAPGPRPPEDLDLSRLGTGFWLAAAGGAALLLGAAAGVVLVAWWFTRFQVGAEHVRVRSGVLFRRERQARLDRVQAIDIHRPFVPRLLGLAELKFEVADAGESAVSLAYLTHAQARALRAELLGRLPRPAAPGGRRPAPWAHPPAAPAGEEDEHPVLAVPAGRLIGSVLASGTALVLVALLAAAPVALLADPVAGPGLLAAWIPGLLSFGAVAYRRVEQGWRFRLLRLPAGLRVRHGLLGVRSQTVPVGRIQAVGVDRPLLWRPFGWYRVRVNVAGYGPGAGDEEALRSTLLPVGTRAEVHAVLRLALPAVPPAGLAALVDEGLHGSGGQGRFTTSPRRARWLDPLTHRRTGFAADEAVLVVRGGRLARRAAVVPHEKTQSVAVQQGPLERALALADVHLHSVPGPVSVVVPHLDAAAARGLAAAQAVHATGARRLADAPRPPRPPQEGP